MLVFICERTCLAHTDVKSMWPVSIWGRRGRHLMVFGLQLPMQSVPITTKVRSNPSHGKVYSIQQTKYHMQTGVRVLSTTFNNISVISW
jgi:hypothetical protein